MSCNVMYRWTHVPTHSLQELETPVPHDIFVMDDSSLHCDMRQRTESFGEKNTGLICSPRNRSLTLSQFPTFLLFTLAPNHPCTPITSLTKLDLTRGFFFIPEWHANQ